MFKFLEKLEFKILKENKQVEFKGIEYDSRKIKEGYIFVALEGAVVDGHNFIDSAVEKGASCILVSKEVELKHDVTYIYVENLRKQLGVIASNFYDWPQNKLKIIGITGTNGKTTSTYIIEKLIGEDKTSRIGTIEYKVADEIFEAINTTPESLDLVKIAKKSVEKNMEYLLMEVSSHALEIGRVDMFDFDVAMFTNLSPEHLDYHINMDDYFLAKRKLFEKLKKSGKTVINIDDSYGAKLYEDFPGISYALASDKNNKPNISGRILEIRKDSQKVEIKIDGETYNVNLRLLGKFNLYNVLGSIGVALSLGIDKNDILKKLEEIENVSGRFELLNIGQDFMVVIDYAHTADALENILKAVNEIKKSRIITVFGCGGDRDKTKRPIMGKVVSDLSDIAIVTSDNPRTEDPDEIVSEVIKGIKKENYISIVDRTKAIAKAIEIAEKDDIILVAGKGHETYQIIGRKKYHFDDREFIRKEIILRKKR